MIIMKKALPRRTFLKGVHAALALPLLDAMIPAATALAKTPAKPVARLGFVFIPMGCDHSRWTPKGQDTLGDLSPILSSLVIPNPQNSASFAIAIYMMLQTSVL